eukprot:TRINITY_DN17458_c0_g1_i4.p1 TRINITY_DN17458_c0_g1~~TRINITY_DN17458_c0_g1_i4.p1  ORF type:complete len:261 (+),score=34.94 TRINITY_DN17458_c0_g1_i4:48-830(+)
MTTPNFEKVCELNVNLTSPIEVNDALYMVAQNGDIFKLKEGQLKNEFHLGGNPSGITTDGKNLFVAEMANQAILNKPLDDKASELSELTKDFESNKFLGPNSIIYSAKQRYLYFTDSGPFCDTSVENKKGSVFAIELDNQIIRPLALNCLAYPCGLALAQEDKILYVCETCENRILRFVSTSQGISYFSTFVQFVGRFGPTACEVSASNLLYVARYEFATISSEGLISIVTVSYTHLRAHETGRNLVCRLLLEKKKKHKS